MATKTWAILTILFTTLITSTAQLFYKLGASSFEFDIMAILSNHYLISGIALYCVGGTLLIVSLRGGEVSVLYPIIATSYIWVTFLSFGFLKETINVWKIFGISFIIAGIISIGLGSKDTVPGAI